jgi:hypothetical protein
MLYLRHEFPKFAGPPHVIVFPISTKNPYCNSYKRLPPCHVVFVAGACSCACAPPPPPPPPPLLLLLLLPPPPPPLVYANQGQRCEWEISFARASEERSLHDMGVLRSHMSLKRLIPLLDRVLVRCPLVSSAVDALTLYQVERLTAKTQIGGM